MKLSKRLRDHQWKSSSLALGDHGWDYDDDPVRAANLLDECEIAFEDVLSFAERLQSSGADGEPALMRARAALAKLRDRPIISDFTPYYILDENKRRALPFDVDSAIDIIREEFIAGHSHGTLCAKDTNLNDIGPVVRATGEKDWSNFERRARAWLAHAIDLALTQPK